MVKMKKEINSDEKIKKQLVKLLEKHPEGLTVREISKQVSLHRQTVTKYLFELKGAGMVYRRPIGSATLYYLVEYVKHAIKA